MKTYTYITDMQHFVDEDGLIADMPAPATNLALFLGSIVAWMTRCPVDGVEWTNDRKDRK